MLERLNLLVPSSTLFPKFRSFFFPNSLKKQQQEFQLIKFRNRNASTIQRKSKKIKVKPNSKILSNSTLYPFKPPAKLEILTKRNRTWQLLFLNYQNLLLLQQIRSLLYCWLSAPLWILEINGFDFKCHITENNIRRVPTSCDLHPRWFKVFKLLSVPKIPTRLLFNTLSISKLQFPLTVIHNYTVL